MNDIFDYIKAPCIAAHRGSCGGNIPPNTIYAYDAALAQGASILEVDIARCADGVFYMFHTGTERFFLGAESRFEEMRSKDLNLIKLRNEFGNQTQYGLDKFDDVLEHFKGRCVFNLDRCWQDWQEIIPLVERHGMKKQILLKSPCKKEWLYKVSELAPGYAYMPIIHEDMTPFYEMGGADIPGFVIAELVFSSENSPVIKEHIVEKLHKANKLAWGNGIQFSQEKNLNAGHNDDVSVTGRPEDGWGWLLAHGFDIIQTDWVGMLHSYLQTLGATNI